MTLKSQIATTLASSFHRALTPDEMEIIDRTCDMYAEEIAKLEEPDVPEPKVN